MGCKKWGVSWQENKFSQFVVFWTECGFQDKWNRNGLIYREVFLLFCDKHFTFLEGGYFICQLAFDEELAIIPVYIPIWCYT